VENIETPGKLENACRRLSTWSACIRSTCSAKAFSPSSATSLLSFSPSRSISTTFAPAPAGSGAFEADTGRRAGDRGDFTAEEVFIEETEWFIL
jgi:hypothetical protein